jgi:hypothetical protein
LRLILAALSCAGTSPLIAEELPGGNAFWGLEQRGVLVSAGRDDPDQVRLADGWPKSIVSEVPLWGRSPAVLDIDGNGDLEIAILGGDGRLSVFQHDGARYPGFPSAPFAGDRSTPWEDPTHRAPCAVADMNSNRVEDVVFASDIGYLRSLSYLHLEPDSFPVDIGRSQRISTVATAQIGGDETFESIFVTWQARPNSDEEALLHVMTAAGLELRGWPVRCGYGSGASPAVGDITGDGTPEIVVGSARMGDRPGQIWAFRTDGTRVNGFPTGSFESIGGSPIVTTWGAERSLAIFFVATRLNSDEAMLYALNGQGENIAGFPHPLPSGHPFGNPIVFGETPNRAYHQVAFGTFDPLQGHIVSAFISQEHGILSEEFETGTVVGSVVAADVDGDGGQELIAAIVPRGGRAGKIIALNSNGRNVGGFPLQLSALGGGAFSSSPTIFDVNRDGYNDLIAVTTDGRVFVWTTTGRPSANDWFTDRANFQRTGHMVPPAQRNLAVAPGHSWLPEQISLSPYPNPFNGSLVVSYSATQAGLMNVSLIEAGGREILTREVFIQSAGVGSLSLVTGNFTGSSGVYFLQWSMGDSRGSRALIYLP